VAAGAKDLLAHTKLYTLLAAGYLRYVRNAAQAPTPAIDMAHGGHMTVIPSHPPPFTPPGQYQVSVSLPIQAIIANSTSP
jgi:hypothetical protein